MDCSTPGSSVLKYLPEFAQIPVHWVDNAIEPSHPSSPLSPALNLSQHQGLSQWVGSLHLEFLHWPSCFILSGAISIINCPSLFPSSILDTFWPGRLIFWRDIFLPFRTVHGVLAARILAWFAILSSRGPRFVRTLYHLGRPCMAWLIALLSYASPFAVRQGCDPWRGLVKSITIHHHPDGLHWYPAHLCCVPSDNTVAVFANTCLFGAAFSVRVRFLCFFLPLIPACFPSFWFWCCHESLSWKWSRCLSGWSERGISSQQQTLGGWEVWEFCWALQLWILGMLLVVLSGNWEEVKVPLLPTVIRGTRTGEIQTDVTASASVRY